ncbi:MAG: MotA/TolQ/ExbB proton channel family protein [Flavobacteriales bacterium]|nr:MotA/TolQ/ExbB proton channel family protein [Flavobacteriales bacterium]
MAIWLLQITETANTMAEGMGDVVQEEKTLSIFSLLLKGGWVMIPLAILSLLAVYIFVERMLAIRKASDEDTHFMNNIRDFIHDGRVDSAKELCKRTDNPIARMIEKGISRLGRPLSDISTAIENVARLEVFKLEKTLATMATIAGAAPMLGFLGTVIGMIRAFHNMATGGANIEVNALAGGIYEAMVTTAAGLTIGIVAYVGYNILVSRVEKMVNKMEARSIEFLDVLHEPAK